MTTRTTPNIAGTFQHLIYSPKGGIEGVLLSADGVALQLVFRHEDEEASAAFEGVTQGQRIVAEAVPQGPSPKGKPVHAVYEFNRLVSIDGKKPARKRAIPSGPAYRGKIVRFNFARHGEPNGVILDTGDFIHTRPDGLRKLKLKVGDLVEADGDAHLLATGHGWAVEASSVNGKNMAKLAPRH